MPCAFRLDRPSPYGNLDPRCQFNEAEESLVELAGEIWCRFHLPMEAAGAASSKSEWGSSDSRQFYNDLIGFARKRAPQIDLTGVVFAKHPDFQGLPKNTPYLFCSSHIPEKADITRFQFGEETTFWCAAVGSGVKFDDTQFAARTSFEGAHFGDSASSRNAHFGDNCVYSNTEFGDGVDFEHAHFGKGASFVSARLGKNAKFVSAHFKSDCSFVREIFSDGAKFTNAEFEGVSFENAEFGKRLDFDNARTGNYVKFDNAVFGDRANLSKSVFAAWPSFVHTTFGKGVAFESSGFGRYAEVTDSSFGDDALFMGATFDREARFSSTKFGRRANFKSAVFVNEVSFDECSFGDHADFSAASWTRPGKDDFGVIDFSHAHFDGQVSFTNRRFGDPTVFRPAIFEKAPDFHGAELHQGTEFPGIKGFPDTRSEGAVAAYRTLKLAMEQLRARDEQGMFFALEQKSRRRQPGTPRIVMLASWLYEYAADYGRSIGRPLVWLVGLLAAYFVIVLISLAAPEGLWVPHWETVQESLWVALRQTFRPFDFLRAAGQGPPTLFPGGPQVPLWLAVVSALYNLFVLSFVALFLLALRRRFKSD